MNVTYVSALYDIYNSSKVSGRLSRDVKDLLKRGLHLIIFVDEFYYSVLDTMEKSATITIVKLSIDQLAIYNMIMGNKSLLSLPVTRSTEKDTHEYMALMNTKVEFLYRAQYLTDSKYLGWIDAGVSKMLSDKENSFVRLETAKITNIDNVLIPGCYIRYINFDDLCKSVWWVFIGTFLICNKSFISTFYNRSLQSLCKFIANRFIPWEVNVWIDILYQHPDTFEWYYSGHVDELTVFPPKYLDI